MSEPKGHEQIYDSRIAIYWKLLNENRSLLPQELPIGDTSELKQKACSQSPRNRVFPKMFHDMRVPRTPRRHQQSVANIGLIINQTLAGQ